jgi:hypothetical protein
MRTSLALLSLVALNGCATNFQSKPLPADHPASAQAAEAPRAGTQRLIATDELTRQTDAQLARKDLPSPDFQNSGMQQDMGSMKGMDHSKMHGMEMPAASPSGIYTCVMHPEVQQSTPGECPKCGMTLVKKEGLQP